ncbi:DUF2695 domain-containing protein [Pseudonocardia hispaniensis]|uniref:DUF2695 domain-containing protein n=1 Tax=Pseudonocardia hispaniensis TaxID=904933 RepID=A0ABW1IYE0_9PSEU
MTNPDDDRWDIDEVDLPALDEDWPSRPALGLGPAQAAALAHAIEEGVAERGCDGTLRAARNWALRAGTNWTELQKRLCERGGYCDCEVLLNALEPD